LFLQAELREKSWELEPEHIIRVLQVRSYIADILLYIILWDFTC